jgi:hypothetical protein
MESLDYIPGSNFLGITANAIYSELSSEEAYAIFHGGAVSFGDATICIEDEPSYAGPFSFFRDKNREQPVYLHHKIVDTKIQVDGKNIQPKQVRGIYLNSKGSFVKGISKSFSLKSAQDRTTGTSAEGQMFGFESIEAGQVFLFSIVYKDKIYIDKVEQALLGVQRLGKSKNAEYGQVDISPMVNMQGIDSFESSDNSVLVYAESHLAFFDEEFGAPTFKPNVTQLGLAEGKICWNKSQIRTFSYAPWNGVRNTASTARHCIAKGSVFYVENASVSNLGRHLVGAYQAEGLGRIVYNPKFLQPSSDNPHEAIALQNATAAKPSVTGKSRHVDYSKLIAYLTKKHKAKKHDERIAAEVHKIVYSNEDDYKKYSSFKRIKASQWGVIRNFVQMANDIEHLEELLFKVVKGQDMGASAKTGGALTRGVAYKNYWGSNKERNLNLLKDLISTMKKELDNSDAATLTFVEKLVAEIAKDTIKHEKVS